MLVAYSLTRALCWFRGHLGQGLSGTGEFLIIQMGRTQSLLFYSDVSAANYVTLYRTRTRQANIWAHRPVISN